MADKLNPRPYAQSLCELISETPEHRDEILEQFQGVLDLLEQDEQFRTFVETPSVSRVAKSEFLHKIFGGKCHDLFVNFLRVLAQKGGLYLLPDIHKQVVKILELKGGKVRVSITTVNQLSDELRTRITEQLKAKFANDIILEENTDPQILGGFVLQVEDTLINCSIKNHLNKIKNSILERSKSYGI